MSLAQYLCEARLDLIWVVIVPNDVTSKCAQRSIGEDTLPSLSAILDLTHVDAY